LVIVEFDDATVKAVGTFPIPRETLAEVLQKIVAGEPELIGLDWVLSEKRTPAADEKLAAVIASAGNIILVNNFGSEQLPPNEPLPEFRKGALDIAFVNEPVDEDGLIRRMFLWMRTRDFAGVSFPVALASNYLGKPLQPGRRGTYHLGQTEIPLDGIGPNTALIGFWSSRPAQTFPAQRLLSPDFDAGVFKKKIVLVGQSSAAAKDFYATPVFRFRRTEESRAFLSGTEIHAAALASILTGKVIRVMNRCAQAVLDLLLVWLLVALVISVRPLYSIPAVGAALVGMFLLAEFAFGEYQVWMKFVLADAGIVLALPAGLGYRFLEERRLKADAEAERGELMGIFERYVSPEVAAEIWNRRGEIVLAGQEKTATVLFSDIRNFTALTSGKPSAEVLAWLNEYFTAMSEVIKANGGFLNKFIGDGMLVVFGVPLSDGTEKDACRAVQAAQEMLEQVEKLNAQQSPDRPRLAIGIGLHTGPLTAGNVGARDRLEYSVIGETVNLASRLEALTKEFKAGIVLSPQTRELVKGHFLTRLLGETMVRGFTEKIQVHTVTKESTLPEVKS
jgi:class 3 adenylate cyclase/CHASE2 domain-containing sensor protein